jgi:hypothetical protein
MLQTRGQFQFQIDIFLDENLIVGLSIVVRFRLAADFVQQKCKILDETVDVESIIGTARRATYELQEIHRCDEISEPVELLENQPLHAQQFVR